jgi:hypothetical protein
MNDVDLMSPSKVAAEYGGDKRKIQQAAQMGLIDPTVAVMAGMFIDRMRGAAMKEQQPQSTVAQDVMAPQGLMAAQAAPVQSGVDTLPVSEDMVPNEYAGGGIIAFEEGGSTSPFARDIQAFGERGRQSVLERTPGMLGAYNQPLITPEEDERMRLLQIVNQKYGPRGSLVQGYFMNQSPADRAEAVDIVKRAPMMSLDELRQTAGALAASSESRGLGAIRPAAPVPEGAPMTGADMRKADRAEMALRSAPGLTPAQSAAAVSKDRQPEQQVASAKEEAAPALRRPSVAPARYEDALTKAKTAMGDLPKEDVFADIKSELAERKGKANEDLRQRAWMRVAEAGFGMMSGTSRYAAVNAGKAAVDAIKGYGEDLSNQKKLDREDRKMLMDIKRLEKAEAREDVFKTTELAYKILNEANEDVRARLSSETNMAIEESRAGTSRESNRLTRDFNEFNKAMTLANSAEQNIRSSLSRQAENPLSPVYKAIKANPNYIDEQAAAARNRVLKDFNLTVPSMDAGAAPPPVGGAGWSIKPIK